MKLVIDLFRIKFYKIYLKRNVLISPKQYVMPKMKKNCSAGYFCIFKTTQVS